jgi:hypothetical protein
LAHERSGESRHLAHTLRSRNGWEVLIHVPPRDPSPSQFGPEPLPDEPHITLARVLAAVGVGLFVFGVGYMVHHTADTLPACYSPNEANCPQPIAAGVTPIAWLVLGVFASALVLAWPWVSQMLRRIMRRG